MRNAAVPAETSREERPWTYEECFIHTVMTEAQGVMGLIQHFDKEQWSAIVTELKCSTGKVVLTGVGKSGLIARKIAATLSSTGTPSYFIHPTEALHGDMGMIGPNDTIILLSHSGETKEVLELLACLSKSSNVTISITGNPNSRLARLSKFTINASVEREACPLQLAPTASTTAALVLGDALAVSLMVARNFMPEDFALFHPGGDLGRKLLTKVRDVMRKHDLPVLPKTALMTDLIRSISEGRMGLVVIEENNACLGIVTDGDLRRAMEKYGNQVLDIPITQIMTASPRSISPDAKLLEAEQVMVGAKITSLLVKEGLSLKGIIQIYDI